VGEAGGVETLGGSDTAVVTGGWVPAQHDDWTWDLTVPGNNDHDFYILAIDQSVLAHNANQQVHSIRIEPFPDCAHSVGIADGPRGFS
jgi:hypothetical protein